MLTLSVSGRFFQVEQTFQDLRLATATGEQQYVLIGFNLFPPTLWASLSARLP